MSTLQLSALLLAFTASPLVLGGILQPRYVAGQWIELPDGEIAEWVGPASSASLNILTGTAKASVIAMTSTAPQVVSTVTGGTALSSISSLIAPAKAANTPAAAPAPSSSSSPPPVTPTSTPVAITHSAVPIQAVSSLLSSEASEAATLITATAAASAVAVTPVAAVLDGGVMTVAITNNWPSPLSISYLNNAGSPSAIGSPGPAPLGTTTIVAFPTGWAGRIDIGSTVNSADSKIEGSTTGANDIDVSYVDGFSVPITCSVAGTPVTGCNVDLWSVSGPCANSVGNNAVCLNPAQGLPDGPVNSWFAPCVGAAYTYPNDNAANDGNTGAGVISCCIGTAAQGCAAPARQGKRDLGDAAAVAVVGRGEASAAAIVEAEVAGMVEKRNESENSIHKHSHLARHLLWRRSRSHGVARGLKELI